MAPTKFLIQPAEQPAPRSEAPAATAPVVESTAQARPMWRTPRVNSYNVALDTAPSTLDDELSHFEIRESERARVPEPFPDLDAKAPESAAQTLDENTAAMAEALSDATRMARTADVADVLEGVARRVRRGEIAVSVGARGLSETAALAAVLTSLLGDRE